MKVKDVHFLAKIFGSYIFFVLPLQCTIKVVH